ncbi:L-histidine N(alpha)-methyltransferase [Hirschia litorea]|uniref:L-histidine N(Alpha)-methyltransferase n=1 Tax=Hirschia litorea TaxID=1199156 RepID=A0ABW2IP48_9PROT
MLDMVSRSECEFFNDVIEGMSASPKTLPCKYFYDKHGSDLFEEITQLPEYYPTRTELDLLSLVASEIREFTADDIRIVEYGAGALRKVRLLLDTLDSANTYVPIDVSKSFLLSASQKLQDEYPDITVQPIVGSFLDPDLKIPASQTPSLGFFPGSTLGNLDDKDIRLFLSKARKHLGPNGQFLLGVDINQDPDTLIPAYNDAQGITADFNLNLLARINHELGANFQLSAFKHEARWNAQQHKIEMHLVSEKTQSVSIGGHTFNLLKDESIHTENSRKFTLEQIEKLATASNWKIQNVWQSPSPSMALVLLN